MFAKIERYGKVFKKTFLLNLFLLLLKNEEHDECLIRKIKWKNV